MKNILLSTLSFLLAGHTSFASDMTVKQCHIEDYKACFQSNNDMKSADYRYPSKAFQMFHTQSTGKAAVLVHGLTDSAYSMKDTAAVLYQQGYDVYAVLLPGHGTRPEDLLNVTLEQWQRAVHQAVTSMQSRSKDGRVLMVGYSTGGTLITAEALKNAHAVSALIYFAPAFELVDGMASFACIGSVLKPWVELEKENSPVRYNSLATNGVCQLTKIMNKVRDQASQLQMPILNIVLKGDQTIRTDAALAFTKLATNPTNESYLIEVPLFLHRHITFRENAFTKISNPSFPQIQEKMIEFVNRF